MKKAEVTLGPEKENKKERGPNRPPTATLMGEMARMKMKVRINETE